MEYETMSSHHISLAISEQKLSIKLATAPI